MAEVRWSALARREMRSIIEYVADESVQGARELRTRIDGAANQLKEYPLLGQVVPEFHDAAVRELIVGNYRLVYHFDEDITFIVTSCTAAVT